MAPKDNISIDSTIENDSAPEVEWVPPRVEERPQVDPVQVRIVWRNVLFFGFLHLASVYGLFLVPSSKPLTWLFSKCTVCLCM